MNWDWGWVSPPIRRFLYSERFVLMLGVASWLFLILAMAILAWGTV